MRRVSTALLAVVLVAGLVAAPGCTMQRHREHVRMGFFTKGLHRDAFLQEWGPPTRTFPLPAREPVLRTGYYGGYWEKPIYEVWEYRSRAFCLVFDRVRLVAWETGTADCDPGIPPIEELREQPSASGAQPRDGGERRE
jgi:hypothetical protein